MSRWPIAIGTAIAASLAGVIVVASKSKSLPPQPATRPVAAAHAGMVWVAGGPFAMGNEDPKFADAGPVHPARVGGFWMDTTDVTNDQFAAFVHATGYVTVAEQRPDPRQLPGLPADQLVPGSVVFAKPDGAVALDDPGRWWRYVPGANWRHPEGPATDLAGRGDHPVVDVAWPDAVAYAKWAGKRLPTEAEWEFAARGGLDRQPYVWGDVYQPAGRFMANTFQGHFPNANSMADGFANTSPVHAFPPNGFGLYDMAGNVWQWCDDWYAPDAYRGSADHPGDERSMRGGSFLCTDQYCCRYRVGTRGHGDPDTPLCNVGFRCVADGTPPATNAAGPARPASAGGSHVPPAG